MLGTSRKIFAIRSIVVLSEVLDIVSRVLQRDQPRKCRIVLFHSLYFIIQFEFKIKFLNTGEFSAKSDKTSL